VPLLILTVTGRLDQPQMGIFSIRLCTGIALGLTSDRRYRPPWWQDAGGDWLAWL